jgi:hypothetical protein
MYQTATNGSLGYVLHHIASEGVYYLYGGRGAVNGSSWDWSYRAYPNQDGSYVEFRTSARAPIFYDRDNTGYYADLAGDLFAYRVYGAADTRSPIFYDYNNTGYYCDPNSTSNLNAVTCISLTETSSERYKENIYTLDNALDKVLRLRGVSYNRKGNKTKEIGVIAEEIASVVPEVLKYNVDGEPDSVSYGRITALLIEAIKELKQEIEILKQK